MYIKSIAIADFIIGVFTTKLIHSQPGMSKSRWKVTKDIRVEKFKIG